MFASPAPAAEVEEIVYEKAKGVGNLGSVIFVTALTRHEARERETRESHVFLPRENLHLHDIVCTSLGIDDAAASLAEAVCKTHELFAALVRKRGSGVSGLRSVAQEGAGLSYVTCQLAEHPFHEFRLRGWFGDAMWEIQDWTVSAALREALARVTCYRADAEEAERLREIFAGG